MWFVLRRLTAMLSSLLQQIFSVSLARRVSPDLVPTLSCLTENSEILASQDEELAVEELAVEELIHDLIARRAYEIWEREGKAEDRDQQHWFQAISELAYDTDEDRCYEDEDAAIFDRKRIPI